MTSGKCSFYGFVPGYALGLLPEEDISVVSDHIEECDDCLAALKRLDTSEDALLKSIRSGFEGDHHLAEPQCQEVVSQLRHLATTGAVAKDPTAEGLGDLGCLGDYRLVAKIGAGGMGTVYRAIHTKLGREVAIKVLPPDRVGRRADLARFDREIRAVGALDHPAVVRALDAREVDGTRFLVMEYVKGDTLSKVVQRRGRLACADACELVRQTACGLQYVHEHDMVHRDIKPSNLILTPDGNVKILDLGLARFRQRSDEGGTELTNSGEAMGTADYMAPEQISDSHQVDIRADIYSLGCTLYKLLVGQAPFSGEQYQGTFNKFNAHVHRLPADIKALRPEVPRKLVRIIDRMLAKDPADRFATPAEVATAMEPYTTGCDLPQLLTEPTDESSVDTDRYDSGELLSSAHRSTRSQPRIQPQGEPQRIWTRRKPLVVVAVLAAAVLLALLAVTVSTPYGTLVVETDDPNVRLEVTQGGELVKIIDADSNWKISLKKGEYEIEVVKGNDRVTLDKDAVTVTRGAEVRVRAVLKSTGPDAVPPVDSGQTPPPTTGPVSAPESTPIPPATPRPPAPTWAGRSPEILPEPINLEENEPLSRNALVAQPASIKGVQSWTIETKGHRGMVNCVAYSPDGKLLASAGNDATVRICNATDARLLRILVGHDGAVQSLAFSPDGRWLATGSQDSKVRLWEVATGRLVRTVHGFRGAVTSVAWSPDGKALAGADGGVVRIVEAATGATIEVLSTQECRTAVWAPDGHALAISDGDRVGLWNPETMKLIRNLTGQGDTVWALAWSPDSKKVATGSEGKVRIFNTESGEMICQFDGRTVFAWSPDGETVAVQSGAVHSAQTGEAVGKFPVPVTPQSIAWSPDGLTLVLAGRPTDRECSLPGGNGTSIAIVGARNGTVLHSIHCQPGATLAARWSADGRHIATVGDSSTMGALHMWDVATGMPIWARSSPNWSGDLAWLDQRRVYCRQRLLDAETGDDLPRICNAMDPELNQASLSPDRSMVAWYKGNTDGTTAEIWDVASRKRLHTIDTEAGGIKSIAWSPDGETIGVTTWEHSFQLWNVKNGKRRPGVDGAGISACWSPDGRMVTGVRFDGAIMGFDVVSGKSKVLWDPKLGLDGSMIMSFSPDGRTIAALCEDEGRGQTALSYLIDGTTWQARSTFALRTRTRVTDTSWSSDNTTLTTATSEGPIHFWNTTDGRLRATMVPLVREKGMIVSPEGHYHGSPGITRSLVYVVETDDGQQTLTPEEFTDKYGWQNDPQAVLLQ